MKHEGDILAELGKLPKTLNESYRVIHERIKNSGPTSQQIADRAMKWMLCSMRRLHSSELIAAVSVNSDGKCVFLDERGLLDICCNLIVLDEELDTFRFAHLSVQEYLELSEDFSKFEANALALRRCVDVYIPEQDQSELTVSQNNILRSYAAICWPFHCQHLGSDPEDEVKNHVKKFLIQNSDLSPSFKRWHSDTKVTYDFWNISYEIYELSREFYSSPPSLLFLACVLGLTWVVH